MKRAGEALSVVVLLLSAALAGRLGFSLGASDAEKLILAAVSVALEGWKVLLPFVIAAAWTRRNGVALLILPPLWLLLTAYSFVGGLTFSESNRASVSGTREASVERTRALKAELGELLQRLAARTTVRSADEVDAQLTAKRQTPVRVGQETKLLAAATADCTQVVTKRTTELCVEVASLTQELAQAHERHRLEARRDALTTSLAGLSGLDHAGVADPQLAALSALTGFSTADARRILSVVFALLLEAIGGLGLVLASLLATTTPDASRPVPSADDTPDNTPETDAERLERYLAAATVTDPTTRIVASKLHADYARWSEREGASPLSLTAFGVAMTKRGTEKVKIDGLVHYQQITLKEPETS